MLTLSPMVSYISNWSCPRPRLHITWDSRLSLTQERESCVLFCLFNTGKLYITGGDINKKPTNLAEMIEVANQTGAPTALPPMQELRSGHALAVGGSFLFAFGGINERSETTSSCEFYDSRINR